MFLKLIKLNTYHLIDSVQYFEILQMLKLLLIFINFILPFSLQQEYFIMLFKSLLCFIDFYFGYLNLKVILIKKEQDCFKSFISIHQYILYAFIILFMLNLLYFLKIFSFYSISLAFNANFNYAPLRMVNDFRYFDLFLGIHLDLCVLSNVNSKINGFILNDVNLVINSH
jgi:hypothetical protein